MGIASIDNVKPGDWLVCDVGPKIMLRSPFSEELVERRDTEMEGVLAKVLAINPPIILLKMYPLGRNKPPFPVSLNFHDAGWARANPKYKSQYLKTRKSPGPAA